MDTEMGRRGRTAKAQSPDGGVFRNKWGGLGTGATKLLRCTGAKGGAAQ